MTLLEITNSVIGNESIELPSGPGESADNPLLVMIENVPYGAYFKCSSCQQIGRSILAYDCYGSIGEPLKCEYCTQRELRSSK